MNEPLGERSPCTVDRGEHDLRGASGRPVRLEVQKLAEREAAGLELAELAHRRVREDPDPQAIRRQPAVGTTEDRDRGRVVLPEELEGGGALGHEPTSIGATRDNPEVLAAALGVATGHSAVPRIDELLAHPAWYVRMQAAKLIGRMGRKEDAERLERLLSDAEWWVRYRAAKALVRLLGVDVPELECVRLRLHDRYARDILEQAIAE